jgi:hypothetical protein
MKRKPPAKSGVPIDVARVVSVGRNREGQAVLRFRDTKGRLVAVKPRPRQFRTLANGVLGRAEALRERRPESRRIAASPGPCPPKVISGSVSALAGDYDVSGAGSGG